MPKQVLTYINESADWHEEGCAG